MIKLNFFKAAARLVLILSFFSVLMQCVEEEEVLMRPTVEGPVTKVPVGDSTNVDSTAVADSTGVSDSTVVSDTAVVADSTVIIPAADCQTCAYVVPATSTVIDGKELGLKPGSVIGLASGYPYKNLLFRNLEGTESEPIIIKNCGGTAIIDAAGYAYTIKTENSKHFRITGGDSEGNYGMKISGGNLGITLDKLSTDFEVDHVEISNVGFAGIMAKTDPNCDINTTRGYFTMRNVLIHDNYVHDAGGEGLYVGNSKYAEGQNTSCGLRYPHDIENVKIYNNITKNTGWEGIQLGSGKVGAEVYNNSVENFGLANKHGQNNGMQIGAGTNGMCYNNIIKNGMGNGLIVMGLGDNIIHNNIIVNAGANGIFCDDRATTGQGFKFINNTIVNPKLDGIRLYATVPPMNMVINNIIVNPGSYSTYADGNTAYVYKQDDVKVQMANNYFTRSMTEVKFADAGTFNYRLASGSPAINKGQDISSYNIDLDYYNQLRLKGMGYDIGASEF